MRKFAAIISAVSLIVSTSAATAQETYGSVTVGPGPRPGLYERTFIPDNGGSVLKEWVDERTRQVVRRWEEPRSWQAPPPVRQAEYPNGAPYQPYAAPAPVPYSAPRPAPPRPAPTPTPAAPLRTGLTDESVRLMMDGYLTRLSRSWIAESYKANSARIPEITGISQDQSTVSFRVDFEYTSNRTETTSFTMDSAKGITCTSYRYWKQYCALDGQHGGIDWAPIIVGGVIILGGALLSSGTGSSSGSSPGVNPDRTRQQDLQRCLRNASQDWEYANCRKRFG